MKNLIIASLMACAFATASTRPTHKSAEESPTGSTSTALGSGSECQEGCQVPQGYSNGSCVAHYHTINGIPFFEYAEKKIYYPHYECRFAWGADNCVILDPNVLCLEIKLYGNQYCNEPPSSTDKTWTSLCNPPQPPGGGN